jgi:hypothetical protein
LLPSLLVDYRNHASVEPPIVVIAPDSFKGSVSAPDAALAIGRGLSGNAPALLADRAVDSAPAGAN